MKNNYEPGITPDSAEWASIKSSVDTAAGSKQDTYFIASSDQKRNKAFYTADGNPSVIASLIFNFMQDNPGIKSRYKLLAFMHDKDE